MRRQAQVGRVMPAGSSRDERLDPFLLPITFAVRDQAADGHVRVVQLTRDRVVVRRAVRGIKMALNLPVTAYLGVAVRLEPPQDDSLGAVAVVLEHRDHALSLPLFRALDGNDIVAEWQSWGRALRLPLLVVEPDGRLREAFDRLGALRIAPPAQRRRRRSAIRQRRPSLLMRRKVGGPIADAPVRRGEREIIARH